MNNNESMSLLLCNSNALQKLDMATELMLYLVMYAVVLKSIDILFLLSRGCVC